MLLYCELENFVSQKVHGGYETRLRGGYEIFDSEGHRVFRQALPEDSDHCANLRRDFYVAYRLHMPSELSAGDYEMRLAVEDMLGQRQAVTKLSFKIR